MGVAWPFDGPHRFGILPAMSTSHGPAVRALVGYDGSLSASTAIQAAARLLPAAVTQIVYLWEPPFDFPELRHRLRRDAATLDELMEALEREGSAEAERVAGLGVAIARDVGWTAQPLVQRGYGGLGYQVAQLAERHRSQVVVVGSRGLSGLKALLGSVSDVIVHISPVPALVVPHPLTTSEWTAAADGPVLVAHDGSPGSFQARARAAELFPGRRILQASVDDGHEMDAVADVVRLPRRGLGAAGIAETLSEYAARQRAAVLVVGTQGRSAGHMPTLGGVARAVAHHAQRPVFIVPPDRRASRAA